MRKYHKGERFETIEDVIAVIRAGQPLYWNHKVQTQGWMLGQRLQTLLGHMGRFYRAIPIQKELDQ